MVENVVTPNATEPFFLLLCLHWLFLHGTFSRFDGTTNSIKFHCYGSNMIRIILPKKVVGHLLFISQAWPQKVFRSTGHRSTSCFGIQTNAGNPEDGGIHIFSIIRLGRWKILPCNKVHIHNNKAQIGYIYIYNLVGGIQTPVKKYKSQLGLWHSQYMESHKSHVPNHQPVIYCCGSQIWKTCGHFEPRSDQPLGNIPASRRATCDLQLHFSTTENYLETTL